MKKYIKFYVLFVLTLSLTSLSCFQEQKNSSGYEDIAYSRIKENKPIRIAYISYPPSFIVDPNTKKFSGIFFDVINEIAKRTGFKIEFVEETSWASMIEELQSNKVDIVVSGIWPNSQRGKWVSFTKPLYYSGINAYVRAGDTRFDNNIEAANSPDVKIAVIDGEMSSIIANSDFPKAKKIHYNQMTDVSQLLLEVATGKADITFVETAVAKRFMAKNPGKIREVKLNRPLRIFPNCMMVRKTDIYFLDTLNISIEELHNNGYIDKVIKKYEKFPGSFYRVRLPFEKEYK